MKPFSIRSEDMPEIADLAMPGGNIIDQQCVEVARKLAADQDALIRRCITARIGGAWSDASIIPRLRWEKYVHSPEKMLLLDGKPLITIWPPESNAIHLPRKSEMRWSVKFLEHL